MTCITEWLRAEAIDESLQNDPQIEKIKRLKEAADVIELLQGQVQILVEENSKLKDKRAKDSWAGQVDRQGGSFSDDEIRNSNTWR